jgi:RimJ/RimL family protein N-acetyltransferase
MTLFLRPVTWEDAACLYAWRMTDSSRAMSGSTAPFTFSQHLAWLSARLPTPIADDSTRLLIAWNYSDSMRRPSHRVGMVRFDQDLSGDLLGAVLSIIVDERHRGRGYSEQILRLACAQCAPWTSLVAFIKPDNMASLCAFWAVGFRVNEARTTAKFLCLDWRPDVGAQGSPA